MANQRGPLLALSATLCAQAIDQPDPNRLNQKQWDELHHFYKGKRVLVTGGCGFIGSHIAEKLVSLDAQVIILDNLASGYETNIEHIKEHVTFLQGTVADIQTCLNATKGVDAIFHLAAFVSVPKSTEDPFTCNQSNVIGTFNILEAARINGVTRLVFSSSSAVYGPIDHTCSEDDPCNPISPYGTSKLIGEFYCKQYTDCFGINTVCLRYFNVYGPRQDPNAAYAAVVAKFTNQMKDNKPITIFGDGLQTRDFVHVTQVAEANLFAAMNAPHIAGQVFNIATGTSINLLQLIQVLKKDFPTYSAETIIAPARAGDVKHTSADCSKYQQLVSHTDSSKR